MNRPLKDFDTAMSDQPRGSVVRLDDHRPQPALSPPAPSPAPVIHGRYRHVRVPPLVGARCVDLSTGDHVRVVSLNRRGTAALCCGIVDKRTRWIVVADLRQHLAPAGGPL